MPSASQKSRTGKGTKKSSINLKPIPGIVFGDAIGNMKKMREKSADLIIADPPTSYTLSWIDEAKRILSDTGSLFLFRYNMQADLLYTASEMLTTEDEFVWTFMGHVADYRAPRGHAYITWFSKGSPKINKKFDNSVFKTDDFVGSSWICNKPRSILRDIVLVTTDRGDMVLDPFMGMGASVIVSMDLGRRAVGIESKKKFYHHAYNMLWSTDD